MRVPPAGASPGNASHAPSDRALQGLGSRLGAKKRALPLGRLPGSRPATGEREPHGDDARGPRRAGGRPATREGGRVTASEVMDAIAGTRQGGAVAAFTDPERSFTDPWLSNDAFRATASAPPKPSETKVDATTAAEAPAPAAEAPSAAAMTTEASAPKPSPTKPPAIKPVMPGGRKKSKNNKKKKKGNKKK